jgi:DNA-binding NarL/FixJ family response regulator
MLLHVVSNAIDSLSCRYNIRELSDDLSKSKLELLEYKKQMEALTDQLRQTNKALTIFVQNVEREKNDMEKEIAAKLRSLVIPPIMRLRHKGKLDAAATDLDLLIKQVEDLTTDWTPDSNLAFVLSTTEFRIASLVRHGISTEEIARQLHISPSTVRAHRKNIRRKLNICDARYSLRDFLHSNGHETLIDGGLDRLPLRAGKA